MDGEIGFELAGGMAPHGRRGGKLRGATISHRDVIRRGEASRSAASISVALPLRAAPELLGFFCLAQSTLPSALKTVIEFAK
jgi:hypothetical protein